VLVPADEALIVVDDVGIACSILTLDHLLLVYEASCSSIRCLKLLVYEALCY
jgi:hypothetical protein